MTNDNPKVLWLQCPKGHRFAILNDETPACFCPGCGTTNLSRTPDLTFHNRFLEAAGAFGAVTPALEDK